MKLGLVPKIDAEQAKQTERNSPRGRRKRTLETKKKTENRMRYRAAFPKLRLMEEE